MPNLGFGLATVPLYQQYSRLNISCWSWCVLIIEYGFWQNAININQQPHGGLQVVPSYSNIFLWRSQVLRKHEETLRRLLFLYRSRDKISAVKRLPLVPPAFLTACPGVQNDFKGNRATCGTTMRNRHRLKTPTNFKRSWRMISLLPGLAQQQLPHAKLHGPSRLSGAASCIPIIKDLLRCNLVEQWLSNPTDPAVPICYNDNVTYNHTPLKWPTIATKKCNIGGSNELLSRTIMKNNCNYANPNQISKDISWYIHDILRGALRNAWTKWQRLDCHPIGWALRENEAGPRGYRNHLRKDTNRSWIFVGWAPLTNPQRMGEVYTVLV